MGSLKTMARPGGHGEITDCIECAVCKRGMYSAPYDFTSVLVNYALSIGWSGELVPGRGYLNKCPLCKDKPIPGAVAAPAPKSAEDLF